MTLATNPAIPSFGINTSGQACATYGLADPGACIFKLVARIECANPGACTPTVLSPGNTVPESPKLKISAAFAYTPADVSLSNALKTGLTSNYNVDFERAGKNTKTLAKFCTSLNGKFNQQTLECESPLGPGSFDCRAITGKTHVWFAGFTPAGGPKCMEDATVNAGCPSGTAMRGYNEQGSLICGGF